MTLPTSDRYRRLAASFDEIVRSVPDDRWADPSPCEGWTAIDVVGHVVSTQLDFLTRQPFAPEHPVDASDPIAAWPTVRDLVQAALDDATTADFAYEGYFGPTTFAETIDAFYCADLVVHGWDLATAAGLEDHRSIDPAEMVAVRSGFEPLGENLRQPGLFGAEVAVGEGADLQTRFLAFVGRDA